MTIWFVSYIHPSYPALCGVSSGRKFAAASLAIVLALAVLASGFGGGALAQTAVCGNTPGAGERVQCIETNNSNAIDLDIDGAAISTTANQQSGKGVFGFKQGSTSNTGDIEIKFSNGSITTTGNAADGISAVHDGAGGIKIEVLKSMFNTGGYGVSAAGKNDVAIHVRSSSITVSRDSGNGVFGQVEGAGDLDIHIRDTDIATSGEEGHGVEGYFLNTGNGKLGIRIEGGSVKTTGDGGMGVRAVHEGTGDIDVRISGGASITTSGGLDSNNIPATGVFGWHQGDGRLGIRVEGGSEISVSGASAAGIYGLQQASGAVDIDVLDSTVTSTGYRGIFVWRYAAAGDIDIHVRGSTVTSADIGVIGLITDPTTNSEVAGDIDINVIGSAVTTSGTWGHGVFAQRHTGTGTGDGEDAIDIRVQGSTVRTTGDGGYAIAAWDQSDPPGEDRHIRIAVHGSTVAATGDGGRGIYAWRANGTGDIGIDVRGSSVTTSGGAYTSGSTYRPYGIFGFHGGLDGDVVIRVRDGSRVATEGALAHGIYAYRSDGVSDGDVVVAVQDSTVATSGAGAHGIRAVGQSNGAVHILIRNAVVRATGTGSDGIRVQGGGLDSDGNRRQSVSVGSEVWGGSGSAAGIRLAGGGRVVIGPDGRVGATSGIAILVTRADPTDTTESPRLLLDVILNGRLPEKVVQGRVVNDDGTTAWTVNGVLLFDDAAGGARNVWVPNGAFDVRATGTSLSTLAFTGIIAPRAAVYEALPGVLLRLDEAGGMGGLGDEALLRSSDTPIWARIAVGQGSYEPASATVDARYDHERYSVESGMDFPLDHELTGLTGLTGWAGVRVVSGSATVSAPTGGGRIEARGMGLIGGLAWEGEDDWYGKGRLSLTRYNADLTSETRGGLKSGVTATVHALDLEGGRRFDLDLAGVKTRLTARGLLRRSGVAMGEFEDGLFSTVSVTGADRLAAGAGVDMETGLLPRDGIDRLTLRGSLDAEQVLSGGTKVDVSETELESKAGGTRLGAGFGAAYRFAGYTIGGSAGAAGLGSGDTSYSARLEARFAF